MILVNATFIGKDGSMGYVKGQRYQLLINRKRIRPVFPKGPRPCPYSSVESFLANWDDIFYYGEIVDVSEVRRLISGPSSP